MEQVEHQSRVEALAEDILTDKQLSIDYDCRRQENREALRQLHSQIKTTPEGSFADTTSINLGGFFLQVSLCKAAKLVESSQAELETAIEDVQMRLKKKLQLIGELEGDQYMSSMAQSMSGLKSVSAQDLYNITSS